MIAALSGLGAVARTLWIERLGGGARAILIVNLAGAFVLGMLTGAGVGSDGMLFAGTAFLGSLTTFSTWMLETDLLLRDRDRTGAARLLLSATTAGAALAGAGWAIGSLA